MFNSVLKSPYSSNLDQLRLGYLALMLAAIGVVLVVTIVVNVW